MLTLTIRGNLVGPQYASLVKLLDVRLRANMFFALVAIQKKVVYTARHRYLRGPRPTRLDVITKRLYNSLRTPPPRMTATGMIAEVIADSKYAAIHEKGGVIRPRHQSYLAIPLKDGYRSPRELTNSFVQPSGSGYVVIDGETGEPVFLLVKQVRMPKRPFLGPALQDNKASIDATLAAVYGRTVVSSLSK